MTPYSDVNVNNAIWFTVKKCESKNRHFYINLSNGKIIAIILRIFYDLSESHNSSKNLVKVKRLRKYDANFIYKQITRRVYGN